MLEVCLRIAIVLIIHPAYDSKEQAVEIHVVLQWVGGTRVCCNNAYGRRYGRGTLGR
jgi:hypothetical protein